MNTLTQDDYLAGADGCRMRQYEARRTLELVDKYATLEHRQSLLDTIAREKAREERFLAAAIEAWVPAQTS